MFAPAEHQHADHEHQQGEQGQQRLPVERLAGDRTKRRACDAGRCSRQDAAAAILFGAEAATQNCLQAIQALGGNGYINDYAAGRLLRDAKLYEIGAGTQEIRRMLIGREIYEATA